MSPKNNNKQVSAAVRILQQKRDASARATHLMVKNDSLITYEKAFEGQAAVKKFFIATFLERKIMSTKTSFKRIALVAASALAIAGFSAVPANAAVTVTWSNTYDTTNGYGVVGGTATAVIALDANTTYILSSTGVGSVLTSEDDGTNADHTSPNDDANDIVYAPTTWYMAVGGSAGTDTLTITSAVAGVQTITITPVSSGTPGTATVKNFTWTAAASTAISADKSLFGIVDASGSCVSTTNAANDAAGLAANAESTGSYRADAVELMAACLLVRDGNGNRVASLDSQVWSITAGSLSTGSLVRAATSSSAGTGTGAFYKTISGDDISAVKGATITVTAIKGTSSFTKSGTFDLYGKITSVALTAAATSLNPGTAGADYNTAGSEAATTALAYMVCTDVNGVTVTRCDYDGDATFGTSDDGSAFFITGDSDKVADAPAFVAAAPATAVQAGAITPTFVLDDATAVGAEKTWLQIDNSSLTTGAAKVTYTVYALNAATTATATIKSNSWDFYTSGALSTITVTPAITSGEANELTTVNVSAVDANGYPAEDGTSVSLLASNGGSIAPQTKTLAAGVFATAAALVLGNGDTTVTAVSGSKSGSAVVSVTGGSGEASSLALDAANAATDAANNAYDEAQNATQAASDALAAVTALAAQVKTLIANVKKLTKAVAKLS